MIGFRGERAIGLVENPHGAMIQLQALPTNVDGATPIFAHLSVTNALTANFNLIGTLPGIYDIRVTNPDGTGITIPVAFTIEQGGQADVWVDVSGRSQLRGGRDQIYYVLVGNRGTVNAPAQRIWVSFPSYLTWAAIGQIPSVTGQLKGNTFLAFDVIPPTGSSMTIPIQLNAADQFALAHQIFQLQAWRGN